MLDKKLYLAPLHTIHVGNALDIGTGMGIWAIKLAEQHPEFNVIGADMSLIQPPPPLPNVSFVATTSRGELGDGRTLDYIYLRAMGPHLKNRQTVFLQNVCQGFSSLLQAGL
jgi:hypothetical protein